MAARIDAVPRWTTRLEKSFVDAYSAEEGAVEGLAETEAAIHGYAGEVFEPLCRPNAACLAGHGECGSVPECTGSVVKLRESACGFGVAMGVVSPLTEGATAQTDSKDSGSDR